MAYTEHEIVKMQGIADLAVGLVEQDMVLAKAITHEGIEKFKGKEGDKVVFRVPGRLPARDYEFRTRNNPIITDVYKEATTDITFSGRKYSAIEVTDEQVDFDLGNWSALITAQAAAVGQALNTKAANTIVDAPYEFTVGLGGNETELTRAILWMRGTLNKLRVPVQGRMLVVGTDVETELLLSKQFTAAVGGEGRADDALSNATIGRIYGFNVIVDQTTPADEAYAFVPSGFVLHTAAPAIPQSVGVGATASYQGFSLRWLRDYDLMYVKDRSLVDTYVGSNHVKDVYIPREVLADDAPFDPADLTQHFVRGVKLSLSGTSEVPSLVDGADIYADILGAGVEVTSANQPIKAFVPATEPVPAG